MPTDDVQTTLTTRTGEVIHLRRATPQDQAALASFFTHVTAEDLRFRFLTGMKDVSPDRLKQMTRLDDPAVTNVLAFNEDATLVAVAVLAGEEETHRAEVALTIRADFKQRGISWAVLSHLCHYAARHGYQSIESIESRANHAAIALEKDMDFEAYDDEDDPTQVLLKRSLIRRPDTQPA